MRRRNLRAVVVALQIALVGTAVAPSAGADDGVRPAGKRGDLGDERLSDERTLTRWAHPLESADVRASPSETADVVGALRTETEDARPEVALALRSVRRLDEVWLLIRFAPGAPGRVGTGWVRRDVLGPFSATRGRIVVDRSRQVLRVLDARGVTRLRARVGVGAPATPTPAGRFFVRERLIGDGGVYGPWAIGTSAYAAVSDWPKGGVVGLHGTDRPELVPGRPSHGCVRLRNPDVRRLAALAPPGTPVLIR